MTRTTKANDVPHTSTDPDAAKEARDAIVPKNYGKAAGFGDSKGKTKKDGGGKGNWGHPGDELEDLDEFNPTNPRRRSNSTKAERHDLKSKFEVNDDGPVFEEDVVTGASGTVKGGLSNEENLEDHIVDSSDSKKDEST